MAYRKMSDKFDAKIPKPGRVVVIPKPQDADPHGDFADEVINRTLIILQRTIPLEEREDWTGSSSKRKGHVVKTMATKVELRHKCGGIIDHKIIIVQKARRGLERGDAIDSYAIILSEGLEKKLQQHNLEMHDKRPFPRLVLSEKPKKKRKKSASCVLCGETDACFPEWEGVCDHTLKERKGK